MGTRWQHQSARDPGRPRSTTARVLMGRGQAVALVRRAPGHLVSGERHVVRGGAAMCRAGEGRQGSSRHDITKISARAGDTPCRPNEVLLGL